MKIAISILATSAAIGAMAITLCVTKQLCALQKLKNNGTEKAQPKTET
tara:strand:- start:2141 stop:2284 length:144 start_codon:yes stop_codon:yes gene_type:complete